MDHHGHPGEKMCRLPLKCEGISFGGGMLQALPRVVQNPLVPHNHIFQGKGFCCFAGEKKGRGSWLGGRGDKGKSDLEHEKLPLSPGIRPHAALHMSPTARLMQDTTGDDAINVSQSSPCTGMTSTTRESRDSRTGATIWSRAGTGCLRTRSRGAWAARRRRLHHRRRRPSLANWRKVSEAERSSSI